MKRRSAETQHQSGGRGGRPAQPVAASRSAPRAQTGLRVLVLLGALLLVPMLHHFWLGESGWFAARELERQIAAQERVTALLDERNRVLTTEVMALKEGLVAVEARARTDLGMVSEGETFYLVVDGADGGP